MMLIWRPGKRGFATPVRPFTAGVGFANLSASKRRLIKTTVCLGPRQRTTFMRAAFAVAEGWSASVAIVLADTMLDSRRLISRQSVTLRLRRVLPALASLSFYTTIVAFLRLPAFSWSNEAMTLPLTQVARSLSWPAHSVGSLQLVARRPASAPKATTVISALLWRP